jgi:dephospho-CoA kinase
MSELNPADVKIIGLIGPKVSGKGTVAAHIEQKYGATVFHHSSILYQVLSMLSLPGTRENAIRLSALRKTFGEDTLINALNKKIAESESKLIVVTGIRFENELKNIRKYANNSVWYITAPLETRYARQCLRDEKDDDQTMSYEEFLKLESRITETEIENLGRQADISIDNQGSIEDLYKKCDEIMGTQKFIN